jgi:rhodanese-related sulfurtransferase
MKKIILAPILLLFLIGCGTEVKSIPITEFTQADLENATLLDVRTPEEFAEGHLENAININWYEEDFMKQIEGMPKDKTIYVYCKIGGRSGSAAELLNSSGYTAIDLEGGYDAYLAAAKN